MSTLQDIQQAAVSVLLSGDPDDKCAAAFAASEQIDAAAATLADIAPPAQITAPNISLPDRPARPAKPALIPPAKVPRRRLNSAEGRAALLHAIAHIELNAIDLAFDMVARFAPQIAQMGLDVRAFTHDWAKVGDDEARHFELVNARLKELGFQYGDFDAHGELWNVAVRTKEDVAARLVVAPLILEARGLDVTPSMIDRLEGANDKASADVLRVIYREEVDHVAAGFDWFMAVCVRLNEEPVAYFRQLQQKYFPAGLKPPFNVEARLRAGFSPRIYAPELDKSGGLEKNSAKF